MERCLCYGDVHSTIVDRVPGDCKKMIEIYCTAHVCDLRWCLRIHTVHFTIFVMNFIVHSLKKMVESLNEGGFAHCPASITKGGSDFFLRISGQFFF